MHKKIKEFYKKQNKKSLTVYIILRALIIAGIVLSILRKEYENVFTSVLALALLTIPYLVNKNLKVELPSLLESTIYLFIFSAQILGEINNFYGLIPFWDTMLHTINGFLAAAVGFALIDILNRTEKFHLNMSPAFVGLVAICFSMTIGIIWEFGEYSMDRILLMDTQKDEITDTISSIEINENKENKVVILENINKTVIHYEVDGKEQTTTIEGGYLELGNYDTMKDLIVNFIGAIVFSILGTLYIKNRDKYKFTEGFMPKLQKDS